MANNRKGVYSIKSRCYIARKVMRKEDWAESSRALGGLKIWKKLWKLRVPNKIKVFGWRAYHEILPTRVNLARRRIISDLVSHCCKSLLKSTVHAIWECGAAQDVWAGSSISLQKCSTNQCDVVQLFEFLFDRLPNADFELFLVQSWLIWNQRNEVVHGRQMMDPRWLNKRAMDYLDEYNKIIGSASYTRHDTGLNDKQTLEREGKGSPNEWTSSKEGGERKERTMLSKKWWSESYRNYENN